MDFLRNIVLGIAEQFFLGLFYIWSNRKIFSRIFFKAHGLWSWISKSSDYISKVINFFQGQLEDSRMY